MSNLLAPGRSRLTTDHSVSFSRPLLGSICDRRTDTCSVCVLSTEIREKLGYPQETRNDEEPFEYHLRLVEQTNPSSTHHSLRFSLPTFQ